MDVKDGQTLRSIALNTQSGDFNGQGLQKFTNSQLANTLPKDVEDALLAIINGDKLSIEDIWNLTDDQRKKIKAVLTAGFLTLIDEDREKFIENTEPILSTKSRNEIWERNHECILNVISWQTIQYRQIPTIKAIAEETKLSRVTVTKHLKEYYQTETFKEKENAFKFLREKLLTKVYSFAYDGNMRAAKIFMDATTDAPPLTIKNQQNNYIQVNGIVITEEQIKNLPLEKLAKIHEIVGTEIDGATKPL
jgi:hypothetical protein